MALGDSVSRVVSDTGIGQPVGRGLSSGGRQDSITGVNLSSGSMRDGRIRGDLLGLFGVILGWLSIVVGSLVLLSEGLDFRDCTLSAWNKK